MRICDWFDFLKIFKIFYHNVQWIILYANIHQKSLIYLVTLKSSLKIWDYYCHSQINFIVLWLIIDLVIYKSLINIWNWSNVFDFYQIV